MYLTKITFILFLLLGASVAKAQDSLWVLAGKQPSTLELLQTDAQGYWYVTGNFINYLLYFNVVVGSGSGTHTNLHTHHHNSPN